LIVRIYNLGIILNQFQLTLILLNKDKDKNINKAIIWLKKSGMQGNIEAQQKLKELGVKM
jgi:TPR repeat protein